MHATDGASICRGNAMPLVEVSLAEGRSAAQVRALVHEVHIAVVRSLGADPDNVTVLVREIPRSHWARADITIAERDLAAAAAERPPSRHTAAPSTSGAPRPSDTHPSPVEAP
nr:tautomerase family protein [Quadrisphaera granulorum]